MKNIRIGCGAGCSFDRLEPAIDLIKNGNLDYLVFECLAERTVANDQKKRKENPEAGYTPMLEERMRAVLPLLRKYNVKVVTNMGSANVKSAVKCIKTLANELNIDGLKIAYQIGDDITAELYRYGEYPIVDEQGYLKDIDENIYSANAYLGYEGIVQGLEMNADIVVTGRVADASLFVGPVIYEFGYSKKIIAQATVMAHLLECAGQVTGGYYADPGYKEIEDLGLLGFPIGEINSEGDCSLTKTTTSAGVITKATCIEQLLYEIGDPERYITPNGVVDFSKVQFSEINKNKIRINNARFVDNVDTYKVNIGFDDGYLGIGEISFGGSNALEKARLCESIVKKRWKITGYTPSEHQFLYIGFDSLYKEKISKHIQEAKPCEVRLRLMVKDSNASLVEKSIREIDFMYTNGPSGSSGISTTVKDSLGIKSIIIPKDGISPKVYLEEIKQ